MINSGINQRRIGGANRLKHQIILAGAGRTAADLKARSILQQAATGRSIIGKGKLQAGW